MTHPFRRLILAVTVVLAAFTLSAAPAGAVAPFTYIYVEYGPCDGWVLFGNYGGDAFANFYENGGGCHLDTYIEVRGVTSSGAEVASRCKLWVRLDNPNGPACEVNGPIVRAVVGTSIPGHVEAIGLYFRPCEGQYVVPSTCGYPINVSLWT